MLDKLIFDTLKCNLMPYAEFYKESEAAQDEKLSALVDWIENFITRSHPELGRKGAVCPFVRRAINDQVLFVTRIFLPQTVVAADADKYTKVLADLFFDTFAEDKREFASIVLYFPGLEADIAREFIDGGHLRCRRAMIQRGLALGEFHPSSTTAGTYNPAFPAMHSPVPCFVVRSLGVHDILFLGRNDFSLQDRVETTHSFMKQLGATLSGRFAEAARQHLDNLQQEIAEKGAVIGGQCPFSQKENT